MNYGSLKRYTNFRAPYTRKPRRLRRNIDPEREVSPEVLESLRVVDPKSSEAKRFQQFIGGIAKKLFPRLNFKLKPINFIISDDPEMGAFCVPSLEPTLVGLNKGLLLKAKYIEDIAGILGHELTHDQFTKKYGVEHHNTKFEELSADLLPVVLLNEAGLDPRQYVTFVRDTVFTDRETNLGRLLDVHPLSGVRVRVLDNALAALHTKIGGFRTSPTPIPADIKDIIKQAKHYPHVDYAVGLDFDTLSVVDKLGRIGNTFSSLLRPLEKSPPPPPHSKGRPDPSKKNRWISLANRRRLTSLKNKILSVSVQPSDPEQVRALDELADRFFTDFIEQRKSGLLDSRSMKKQVGAPEEDFAIYSALCRTAYPKNRPLGKLKIYQEYINNFVNANSRDQAVLIASTCLDRASQDSLFDTNFVAFSGVFSGFEPPTNHQVLLEEGRCSEEDCDCGATPVSWQEFVTWIDAKGEPLHRMFIALGIAEDRVFESMSVGLQEAYQNNNFIMFMTTLIVDLSLPIDTEQATRREALYDPMLRYPAPESEDQSRDEQEYEVVNIAITELEITSSGYILGVNEIDRRIVVYTREDLLTELMQQLETWASEIGLAPTLITEEEKQDRLDKFFKKVKIIEKRFLEITPSPLGQPPSEAEKELVHYFEETVGSARRGASFEIDIPSYTWIGPLEKADHNFRLFIRLNEDPINKILGLQGGYWGDPDKGPEEVVADAMRDIDESHPAFMHKFFTKLASMARSGHQSDVAYFFTEGFPPHIIHDGLPFPIFKYLFIDFASFIIRNSGGFFSRKQQMEALNRFLRAGTNPLFRIPISPARIAKFRGFLGYKSPANGKDYIELQRHLKKLRFLKSMLIIELQLLILKRGKRLFSNRQLGTFLIQVDPLAIKKDKGLQSYFRSLLEKYKWPTNLENLIDQWINAYVADIFPSDQVICYELLRRILSRIRSLKDAHRKQLLYEKFILNYRLADPGIRDRIHKDWVETIYAQYGRDKEDRSYSSNIIKILNKTRQKMKFVGDFIEIASLLADKLQTQVELTRKIYRIVSRLPKSELHKSHYKGMAIEGVISQIPNKPVAGAALIDFLVEPLSKNSTNKLYEVLYNETILLREEATSAAEVLAPSKVKKIKNLKIPEARAKAELDLLWENFWSLPFLIRAVLFEKLLFPLEDGTAKDRDLQKANERIFNHVVGRIFPIEEKYSNEAQEFIRAYFKVIPDYQHKILLSAMMVTAEKSNKIKLSLGERLASVLELLGPAETKLGQIIHSHPKTPADIREGMGRLKSLADPPFRWDLFKYYANCVPPRKRKQVSWLGSLLGSASFFLAFGATMEIGGNLTKGVFKILRPHALERARNGFDVMQRMLQHLNLDPAIAKTLEQMISQARKNAEIEVDNDIGIRQTELAVEIYNNRVITLNGESFTLHVAKVLDYGKKYQFIQLAPGVHFNDLPEVTPEQITYKKNIAIVYFTFELENILKGNRFDSDRHGAQMRVRNHDIYLFDWGNLLLEPPTNEQLGQLGQVLVDIFVLVMQGTSLDAALTDTITGYMDSGQDMTYLLEVQKAFLSLEDFRRLLDMDETLQILGNAIKSANPAVTQGMRDHALELGLDFSMLQNLLNRPSSIEVHIQRAKRSLRRRYI